MGDRIAKTELFDQFARVGKALSSGKRLELLDLLAQGERTVDALARASELGLTTASAHLQTLKQANLVATRREGTKCCYRLAGADVAQLFALSAGRQRTPARCRGRPHRIPRPGRHRTRQPGPASSLPGRE